MFDVLWLRGEHARVSRLGDELRRLREAQGLKQIDVAAALGQKTNASVSLYENGRSAPSAKHWKPLAKVLGVTTDHLRQFGAPFRRSDPRSHRRRASGTTTHQSDFVGRDLPASTASSTVAPTPQVELLSVRESEADLLRLIGERAYSTVWRFVSAVKTARAHEEELCAAVESTIVTFLRRKSRKGAHPKAARHSGGVQ